ncbi:MAG TPA: sensor histidine kinase [Candidatus Enterocloster excrementigallinarum]|uniref:histidine kinase n=1 Tax=Candidatus Enterocloster excrementigallinarum TaxID=2838558 RepID=A0A9D2PV42_9FIRM|nr:sensor histidine kinase [Candidatus Enterocloster excrementigallinarum]
MDTKQFIRIYDNLLENSCKYAGTEPVELWIAVKAKEGRVFLEWKDNGPGVPREKLGRIFERFYRCDESRSQKGSGVGLYVVESIVKRLGGME